METHQLFLWRKDEWIDNYISPWSVFERFRFANQASVIDVIKIFAKTRYAKNPYNRSFYNLNDVDRFDTNKILSILGIDFRQSIQGVLSQFDFLQGYKQKLFYKNLVYCPECLRIGYHSVLQQLTLLTACPYHNIPLLHKCPQCNTLLPYQIGLGKIKEQAFQCSCGFCLCQTSINNFKNSWKESKSLSMNSSQLLTWLNLHKDTKHNIMKFISFHPSSFYDSENNSIQRIITIAGLNSAQYNEIKQFTTELSILKNITPIIPHKYYSSKKYSFRNFVEINKFFINTISFERYVFFCLYQIFKAIARRLKRTVLKQHLKCIKYFIKRKDLNKDQCIYALAYVRWRQEIENITEPWRVENGSWLREALAARSIPPNLSIYENSFLHWIITSPNIEENIADLKNINENQNFWSCLSIIISKVCNDPLVSAQVAKLN